MDEQAQKRLISKWISQNIKVEKKMFLNARQGNIKDDYFFEKNVGHGGFGVVYRAKNRLTMKRVAIKAIQKFKITDYNAFIKEYQILSRVDHPNIINVQEIWEWDKMLFIVTDYCYGGDLLEYLLERDRFEENETHVIM